MSTTTTIPLPAGAVRAEEWQPCGGEPARRLIHRRDVGVPGTRLVVRAIAVRYFDGRIEPPTVTVAGEGSVVLDLSAVQTRALAAVLLEAAAEIDGWTAK